MSEGTVSFRGVMLAKPPIGAVAIGLLFVWFSLGPSLLPRAPMMQGVATGTSFMFGYGIGVAVFAIVRVVLRRLDKTVPKTPGWAWLVVALVVAAIVGALVILWPGWQTEQRELVGLPEVGISSGLLAVVWSFVVLVVLFLVVRIVRWLVLGFDQLIAKWLPAWGAHAVTTGLVLLIVLGTYAFIASSGLAQFANARFAASDEATEAGVTQPTDSTSSGSPESLTEWDDLGYQGRTFAGTATSVDDLNSFNANPAEVETPIRVYAGLESADTAEARAQLVVDELIRTGAADREVLVVVATTGTGWVDPVAAAAIEYMYNGDTAIAAMQYSFLPSWISFILDTATSTEAGIAINEAVVAWWNTLPVDDRPSLYAFGESLGSLGSEAAYAQADLDASLAFAQSSVDGVVWIGPTEANIVRGQLVAERDPSPVWKPEYSNGGIVRTANRPGEALEDIASWAAPRVLYFHHPSDPVGYWSWDTLWKPQEWTQEPIGYDVPQSVRWVPFTTFVQ
ncbi:MAG: alpha/beta-hydrolase family protein, partial [Acidimicrobiia bacterium]